MSSFFQTNKSETESLRNLIWFFSFGNTTSTEFSTNGHKFLKTNHIHKLAEALDRTPSNKFGFGIQLPGSSSKVDCGYALPELIELPWSAREPIKNPTFATYKYHNYTPANSASAGTELRNIIGSSNSAYILDCGKRLFHENYTTADPNNNIKGKGVSIFSGIIDSSTVNDPVLNIKDCSGAVQKLQFLIPFIDIPAVTTIFMYCTFNDYTEAIDPGTKNPELFLAFLFGDETVGIETKTPIENIRDLSGNFPNQYIVVSGKDIPDLTNVTNYLAGPVQGCFRSLANTFLNITNTNPCYKYEGITNALYANTKLPKTAPLDDIVNFNKIFQIRFKHIGDKTRLMDAVIINSLSEQYSTCSPPIPLCHTGTIDTFSNRYALLGNLNTITPIKKSNLFINDNKIISKEQQDAIEVFKTQEKARCFGEQKELFEDTIKKIDTIKEMGFISLEVKKYIDVFKTNLVKRIKKIGRLSCLTTDYWDVTVGGKFIQNAYTGPDIQLVESMEIILDDILTSLNDILQDTKLSEMKTFFDSQTVPVNYLLYDNELHVLLDALRLFDLFTVCGITVSADDKKSLQTTKNIMSIATSIAKAGFFPRGTGTREKQEGGGYGIESTYYSDAELINKIFKDHVTLSPDNTFKINDPSKLSKLRVHFIIETIKHKIYEHSDHEPNPVSKPLDALIALITSIETRQDMLEKAEIDKIISEVDSLVSENSNYDTAEVIMQLNEWQKIAIEEPAATMPNISKLNLSKLENRKGFKDNNKLGIQLNPVPTSLLNRQSQKRKHVLPLVTTMSSDDSQVPSKRLRQFNPLPQRLQRLSLKRKHVSSDDSQVPFKRRGIQLNPVFGGRRRTIRRAKRNKTRKIRKN
jgi:hypothetical protein